jgi:hypothetical protein
LVVASLAPERTSAQGFAARIEVPNAAEAEMGDGQAALLVESEAIRPLYAQELDEDPGAEATFDISV